MSTLKRVSNKLYDFAAELVGNRVLDLYLKYNGIKMMTTATLVPVALILGQQAFEDVVRQQQGGKLEIPKDMPVIDDPLIGSYLKLAGITTLSSITPTTLVPLGVLMMMYNLYEKGQIGGQRGGAELMKYVKDTWGNRVLDLFLKYKGITTLTAGTMVPLALILGKDALEQVFEQRGGAGMTLPDDIPVVDDPLVGNYLKLAGLSTLSLNPGTLVPLGLVALLYHIYLE